MLTWYIFYLSTKKVNCTKQVTDVLLLKSNGESTGATFCDEGKYGSHFRCDGESTGATFVVTGEVREPLSL